MSRGASLGILIAATILFGAGAVFSFLVAAVTVMGFAAPGSADGITGVLGMAAMLTAFSFPVVYIASMIVGWILFARKFFKAGALVALTPLLNIVVYVGLILLVFNI